MNNGLQTERAHMGVFSTTCAAQKLRTELRRCPPDPNS